MKNWFVGTLIQVGLIFILSPSVNGQTGSSPGKPDFSGTWLLDTKKSNSSLGSRSDLPITLSHRDPEFRVTLQFESNGQINKHDFVYFTDGRGETNEATSVITTDPKAFKPEDLQNKVTNSKTKWSGNKIVTRARLKVTAVGQFVEFEQVDEWKLSEDGKVLTQTSKVNFLNSDAAFMPARNADKKKVYNRL